MGSFLPLSLADKLSPTIGAAVFLLLEILRVLGDSSSGITVGLEGSGTTLGGSGARRRFFMEAVVTIELIEVELTLVRLEGGRVCRSLVEGTEGTSEVGRDDSDFSVPLTSEVTVLAKKKDRRKT